MAVKLVEMVELRRELATKLLAAVDTHAFEIVTGYENFFAPVLEEGETLFDAGQQLDFLRRQVIYHLDAIESLDVSVVDKIHDTDKVRADVDRLVDVVTFKMRHVRDTCQGLFGKPSVERVGLTGEYSRRPTRLFQKGRLVQQGLRNPDLGLKPVLESPEEEETLTPAQLANRLEPELTELGRLVKARAKENSEDKSVRARRSQTIKDFDRSVGAIGRMLQGMLRLAGRGDLASVFRVALRRFRRRRRQDEGGATAEAAEGTADETPSTEEGTVTETAQSEEETVTETTS